jgi:phosphatidate cytidylyltransferase
MTRIITALIGIPILIYLILYAPIVAFTVVAFIAMLLSLYEFFSLSSVQKVPLLAAAGYLFGSIIFLSFYFRTVNLPFYFPIGALPILIAALLSRIDFQRALPATAAALFGAWYVGGLLGYVIAIRMIDPSGKTGAKLLLMLFVIIWAGDTFAYFIGRKFGRHPLTAVSPRKTVEGSIGGLIFSTVFSVLTKFLLLPELSLIHAIVLGGIVGAMGQIGDLAESLLKRSVNQKDSGSILPGHGGMLDRLDSLLFGAPAMYYYVYLVLYR